jgi:hypothetical protein
MSNIDWTNTTSSSTATGDYYKYNLLDYVHKYYDKRIDPKNHDFILDRLTDLDLNRQAVKRVQSHVKTLEEKMLARGSITIGSVDDPQPVEDVEEELQQEVQYFDPKDLDI